MWRPGCGRCFRDDQRAGQSHRLDRRRRKGFALEPTRRLCLLDRRQRARPFAGGPLVGGWERAHRDVSRPVAALSHSPTKMNGSKGRCPWRRSRRRSLLVGVRAEALALARPKRLPAPECSLSAPLQPAQPRPVSRPGDARGRSRRQGHRPHPLAGSTHPATAGAPSFRPGPCQRRRSRPRLSSPI
jgi:hypothetical protein